jgi:hypothetical protein
VDPDVAIPGTTDTIAGEGEMNVKPGALLVTTSPVTVTSPEFPEPTTAVIILSEILLKDAAGTPPKFTEYRLRKPEPEIVITVPGPPEVGLKELTFVPSYLKRLPLPLPPAVLTVTSPDAPLPTIAVMLVFEFTMKEDAFTPPKLTAVTLLKLVPVIDIEVPGPPKPG